MDGRVITTVGRTLLRFQSGNIDTTDTETLCLDQVNATIRPQSIGPPGLRPPIRNVTHVEENVRITLETSLQLFSSLTGRIIVPPSPLGSLPYSPCMRRNMSRRTDRVSYGEGGTFLLTLEIGLYFYVNQILVSSLSL